MTFKKWCYDRDVGWYIGTFEFTTITLTSRFTRIEDLEYFNT